MLRSVYFGIVYSHLQYGITSWGKAAAKYTDRIRVQQNYIVKIMTSSSFLRVKLSPIYQQLNFLNLNSIYHLEVLKFVYKFRSKTLPLAFHNYFSLSSETHRNISTRFSNGNNLIVPLFKKSASQRSIRYEGSKIWNNLPPEIKNNDRIGYKTFIKYIKTYLHSIQQL